MSIEKLLKRFEAQLKEAFEAAGLPEYMWDGVKLWVMEGIPAGGFLMSVFEDKLVDSFIRADKNNRHVMFEWAGFMYSHIPRACRKDCIKNWKGYRKFLEENEY